MFKNLQFSPRRALMLTLSVLLFAIVDGSSQSRVAAQDKSANRNALPAESTGNADMKVQGGPFYFDAASRARAGSLLGLAFQTKNISNKPMSHLSVERSAYGSEGVIVCNNGSLPVSVADMEMTKGVLWDTWELSGWAHVEPNKCRGIFFGDEYVHLVFGLRTPAGFGIVKYSFDMRGILPLGSRHALKEFCVRDSGMRESGSGSPDEYTPPCPNGYKAAPTSASIFISGNARLTLNVSPSPNDYKRVSVLFDK